jgi:hypothetical protein
MWWRRTYLYYETPKNIIIIPTCKIMEEKYVLVTGQMEDWVAPYQLNLQKRE